MLVAGVGVWQRGGWDPGFLAHWPETGVVPLGRRLHSGNSRDLELLTPGQCPFSSWTLLGGPLCPSLGHREGACVWGGGGRGLCGCRRPRLGAQPPGGVAGEADRAPYPPEACSPP